jgi:transcriptional regulator with XRE-family HTH domain
MDEDIAARIERLRRRRGWTKAELARRAGLHQQGLYKILSGERTRFEARTLVALARALRVSADVLLGLAEDSPEERCPVSLALG